MNSLARAISGDPKLERALRAAAALPSAIERLKAFHRIASAFAMRENKLGMAWRASDVTQARGALADYWRDIT